MLLIAQHPEHFLGLLTATRFAQDPPVDDHDGIRGQHPSIFMPLARLLGFPASEAHHVFLGGLSFLESLIHFAGKDFKRDARRAQKLLPSWGGGG